MTMDVAARGEAKLAWIIPSRDGRRCNQLGLSKGLSKGLSNEIIGLYYLTEKGKKMIGSFAEEQ